MRKSRIRIAAVAAVLLAFGLAVAWSFREPLQRLWGGAEPVAVVSEAAAAGAEAKLERLRNERQSVQLSDVELVSLLRYRYGGWIPPVLHEPDIRFRGDTLRLASRVATAELPTVPEMERVRAFLPDTSDVEVAGRLVALAPGRAALQIGEVSVAGVPLPARLYEPVLRRFRRRDDAAVAPNMVPFALPEGIGAARVEGGFLLLSP